MIILGISAFGQNPAAALLRDGKLIAFAEEERFIRIKSAFGRFPSHAVLYCLSQAGIPFAAVDRIAVGWDSRKYRFFMPAFLAAIWLRFGWRYPGGGYETAIRELVTQRPDVVQRQMRFALQSVGIRDQLPAIDYVPHHLAHAASTYYASGFPAATVVVLDGSGEERATSVFHGAGRTIREISHATIPNSLGWLYASITAYLGFTPYQDDGFVMGLAPYGKPDGEIRAALGKIIQRGENGKYWVNPRYTMLGKHTRSEHFSDDLVTLLGEPRPPGGIMTSRHKNIAYAAQSALEETVGEIVKSAVERTGERRLCLAGGVALNCKMNGALVQSGAIDDIFVQPAAHDAGTALGAAMVVSMRSGDDPRFSMSSAAWGPSYTDKEIQKVLDESGISYRKPKNPVSTIADAIAKGRIVARFSGRMEVGPRALGGRSILANPAKVGMDDTINARVKHREQWRPFCPSMVSEVSKEYLVSPMDTRFMTVIYDVPEEKQSRIPAVVHIDGTTRPQTVQKNSDREYYALLKAVGERTGIPMVLNTSLNVKGEPMACAPVDALRCVMSAGIDALAIGGFWVEKK